jgi:hypothetical protein
MLYESMEDKRVHGELLSCKECVSSDRDTRNRKEFALILSIIVSPFLRPDTNRVDLFQMWNRLSPKNFAKEVSREGCMLSMEAVCISLRRRTAFPPQDPALRNRRVHP